MILKNSLYKVLKKDITDLSVRYDIELFADNIIYQSHFPEEPITPGACIIRIGRELLEDYMGKQYMIVGVKNAKFLSVISPLQAADVSFSITRINLNEVEKTLKAQISVEDAAKIYAKISLILKEDENQ